jgi:hypothetical protein
MTDATENSGRSSWHRTRCLTANSLQYIPGQNDSESGNGADSHSCLPLFLRDELLQENCDVAYCFILFVPCVVDNQPTVPSPTKCTILFPDILYFNITLNTATCFDPVWDRHQGVTLK